MAFSATISSALSTALTDRLPEATEPAPSVVASNACVNNGFLVYIGQGNWIRDPFQPCKSEERK
jgi:hypothetical protein